MSRVVSFTTTGVCPCCTGRTAAALECHTRGGTAAICGFPEFLSPGQSIPYKRYRTLTTSGESYICSSPSSCSATTSVDSYDWDNTPVLSYSISSCAVNGGVITHYLATTTNCAYNASGTASSFGLGAFGPGASVITIIGRTQTRSLTQAEEVGDETCVAGNQRFFGNTKQIITDEDKDSNAITRLLATATFGAFAGCVTYASCCKADYEQRTTSVSFSYHEAEYRVRATITPSTFAYANVYIYRRPFGTVTWTAFGMNVESGTSSVTGVFLTGGTAVPNTLGYETYAGPAFMV